MIILASALGSGSTNIQQNCGFVSLMSDIFTGSKKENLVETLTLKESHRCVDTEHTFVSSGFASGLTQLRCHCGHQHTFES